MTKHIQYSNLNSRPSLGAGGFTAGASSVEREHSSHHKSKKKKKKEHKKHKKHKHKHDRGDRESRDTEEKPRERLLLDMSRAKTASSFSEPTHDSSSELDV